MTDDELKALVADLVIGSRELLRTQKELTEQMKLNSEETKRISEQMKLTNEETKRVSEQMKHTDEQIKRSDEQFKRTDEQFKLTEGLFKQTAEQFKLTDEQFKHTTEQFKRTDEQFKRSDEQFKRTDEQLKRTDEKLKRIGIFQANIAQNQGDVAEEFFFHSLMKDCRLGNIHFDDVGMNASKHRGQIQEQYDIMLTNGDAVAVIEVKYKAHQNDLDKLDRKMRHFKKLFPVYAAYKQYGAIAAFHVNDEVKEEALRRGYFVLQRCGNLVHTESGKNLTVF